MVWNILCLISVIRFNSFAIYLLVVLLLAWLLFNSPDLFVISSMFDFLRFLLVLASFQFLSFHFCSSMIKLVWVAKLKQTLFPVLYY